ncbi:MAG: glycosyltransferase family 2 protein, partial [Deltaproteobacteria bacterium]|nr:glycosyltransferase family 2 protein [Deltaproteobacteria bacterium]
TEMDVMAGLHRSRGAATVLMDADLLHPPELIERFVARWREGYQVVYGCRQSRENESLMQCLPAQAFYWTFKRLADVPLPEGVSDFRLIDRVVLETINAMPEKTRFLKGLFSWIGYKQIGEPFNVMPRIAGRTGWGFRRLFAYALDAFTGFSTAPLRTLLLIGAAVTISAA